MPLPHKYLQMLISIISAKRSKSLPFAIGLFLFSIYLVSFSGKFHVMDELAVFSAGHNLARHGRADINQLIWTNHWTPNPPGVWGRDGNLYTKKPPGISFISAPLIGLGQAMPGLNAVQVGLLTNALATALTAGLLFIWLVDLGLSRPAATLASLGYGLCTFAWVYARMFWESSLLALVLLVALWAVYRAAYLVEPQRRWLWLLVCGIAVAVGLTLRFEAALILLFIGLYLVASQRVGEPAKGRISGSINDESARSTPGAVRPTAHVPTLIRSLALFLIPSIVIGLGLLYFNFVRFGSFGETGYTQEIFFGKPWVGAYGLLFSPGRGLFIYAPLMLLLFFGLRPAWRRLPWLYYGLIGCICLCYWLFYGSWFAWGGTWGWGPRFLLPILPPLMLFVAEPLEWLCCRAEPGLKSGLLWLGVGVLALLSLVVNSLGILVDFNQHFLRLGSNENFVFNWGAFPPLAHWRILREGLVDLIWLRPDAKGLKIEWPALLPALILFVLATVGLVITYRGRRDIASAGSGGLTPPADEITHHVSRFAFYAFGSVVAIGLTFLMMAGTAHIPLSDEQARLDLPVLDTLTASAQPGDALLVSMPPFGDAQEFSTLLMAYLEPSLPIYAWIENEPRAIQPEERERVRRAVQAEARRVWLFERWLTQSDPTSVEAAHLNQGAFQIGERWFAESGKLTLYALADDSQPSPQITPLNIPFQGGLVLVDYAVFSGELTVEPGDVIKLRLTWGAKAVSELPPQVAPVGGIIAFAQLLDQATPAHNIVQSDRLLVDLQSLDQSPLQAGHIIQQGYGLQLADDVMPGSYPLVVGVYHSATGQRLRRADGSPDDFVYLTDILVK
jgi:hypothetical protein